jgi:hypothetical protein
MVIAVLIFVFTPIRKKQGHGKKSAYYAEGNSELGEQNGKA